jgi:hypothetical protein
VIGRVAETTVLESVKIKIGKEMQASKDEAAAEAS